jgi:hypothetical protein
VLVVGDSLEVGSAPHLRAALGTVSVEIDAKPGRTSGEGLRVLAERLRPEHEVVVFPLGTNDTSADAFAANLVAAAQLAGDRCMVVATIARRPLRGSPAGPLNRVVASFAAGGDVQVADWRAAAASPGVLGRDGTHATGQGYALRGGLLAEAVEGCMAAGGGAAGGIPAPEDPNVRVPPRERRLDLRSGTVRGAPPRPSPDSAPPAQPARLPAPAALLTLGSVLRRAAMPVAAALRGARTAATRGEPEPILGAP